MISHKILFKEQQKSVMDHLKKYRREIFLLKDKSDDCILPPLSDALKKLKEYLSENNGEAVEEIQFESKPTAATQFSIKQKDTIGLKGYATCSKEISQPSEWQVDEEDEVPQRKILTAPLGGAGNNSSYDGVKSPTNFLGDDITIKIIDSKGKKKKSKGVFKKEADVSKLPDDQLKNFSKLDLLILEKLKSTFSGVAESEKSYLNVRRIRANVSNRPSEEFDCVEECAHISS